MKSFTFVKCTYGGLSVRDIDTVELKDLGEAKNILDEVASDHWNLPLTYDGYHGTSLGIVYDFKDEDDCAAYHVKIREN